MKKEKNIIEEKKDTKDYSIEKEDQKRLKGISKFLYIMAKIAKVFAIIGIVGLVIAMIAVPIVTSNIKTEKQEDKSILKVFDTNVYYTRSESRIELYEKDKIDDKTVIKDHDEVRVLNKVFDYLEENDMTKITIFLEIEFVLIVVSLIVEIFILNKVYKFFRNIHDKSSPFIEENIDLLKNVAKLMIVNLVISLVISNIGSIILDSSASVGFVNVFEILGVFVLIYIFKYGYKMQKETEGKIYSEE